MDVKKLRWLSIVTLILIVAVAATAALYSEPEPAQAGGTVVVRVYYPDQATGNKVLISFKAAMIETNYEEGYHLMEATAEDIDRLTAAGLQVEVVKDWVARPRLDLLAALAQTTGIPGYPCYRTVEETFATAQAIVNDHPDIAAWIDVGDSWEKFASVGGYDMMVLRLTNSAIPGPKPKLFLTGAMHAREYATAELVTRFAEYLVDGYGTDPDATWILDHHEVHLMLQTNPDGRKQAETGLSWRKNTNQNYCGPTSNDRGADLNRNFTFEWNCCGGSSDDECYATYHGPYPASEPETQAVEAQMSGLFPDQRGPELNDPAPDDATGIYIDVHAYGRLVLWPWGFTDDPPPNATQLQTLGRKFAYWNDHSPKQAFGLYPTDGTSDEHAYGELGVAAYCFEVGTSFFQSCSYFEGSIVPGNIPALLYAAKVVRTPYMTPSGPDATDLAVSSGSVPPGTAVTLSGTIDDTRYNNSNGTEPTQNVAAAEYYVDEPPWGTSPTAVPMSPSDGSFDSTVEGVEVAVDTTGWSEGKHILFVRGQDVNGNWGAFSAVFVTISTGGQKMFVHDIAMSGSRKGANRIATAVVTIRDTGEAPVPGATVYGTWSGDYDANVSGTTEADGTVTFTSNKVKQANATFTFTVDDVVKSDFVYDPALNRETSDAIVVP